MEMPITEKGDTDKVVAEWGGKKGEGQNIRAKISALVLEHFSALYHFVILTEDAKKERKRFLVPNERRSLIKRRKQKAGAIMVA